MSRLFRAALEAEQAQQADNTIVMQGPLAEIYRQALNVAYAKTDVVSGEKTMEQVPGIATESMANDFFLAQRLAENNDADGDGEVEMSTTSALASNAATVYGVAKSQLNDQAVVDLTRALANHPPERQFILIIDASTAGPNSEVASAGEERYVELAPAMEAMARAHKGKTFKNLNELAEHMKDTHTGAGRSTASKVAEAVGSLI